MSNIAEHIIDHQKLNLENTIRTISKQEAEKLPRGGSAISFPTGLVPYVGAREDVNLNSHGIYTTGVGSFGTLISTGGVIDSVKTVTDTYQILKNDNTIVCNKGIDFTVTLPETVVGQKLCIKNIGAGTITVEGNSSDTIDGDLNQVVVQWECLVVLCYELNKWIII